MFIFKIKLLSENKHFAFENLHYQISRQKFEPEPGLEFLLLKDIKN